MNQDDENVRKDTPFQVYLSGANTLERNSKTDRQDMPKRRKENLALAWWQRGLATSTQPSAGTLMNTVWCRQQSAKENRTEPLPRTPKKLLWTQEAGVSWSPAGKETVEKAKAKGEKASGAVKEDEARIPTAEVRGAVEDYRHRQPKHDLEQPLMWYKSSKILR